MSTRPVEVSLEVNPVRAAGCHRRAGRAPGRSRRRAGAIPPRALLLVPHDGRLSRAGPCLAPAAVGGNGEPGVEPFVKVFQTIFPEGAGYEHDKLHLRTELSDEQRRSEPQNADSHLAFIGAGLRNCVTYVNRPNEPVYLVDLDGVNGGQPSPAPHQHRRLHERGRSRARAAGRAGLGPPDRLGEPEGSAARPLRAARGADRAL